MRTAYLFGLTALLCAGMAIADAPKTHAPEAVVTTLATQKLDDYPGREITVITVDYPPGAVDPVHRHDAHAIVYVLEGSIVMGVAGGKPVTLKPGDTFHEGPNETHTIGRNASQEKPAKFVVFLLKDIGKPLLTPVD